MRNYGIKVARTGFDVKTATIPQLAFSSAYKTLKIDSQGSGIITHSGGRTVTIAHNLGYVPFFLVHADNADWGADDKFSFPPHTHLGIGACHINGRTVNAWADTNNLYIKVGDDYGWEYGWTGSRLFTYDAGGYSREYSAGGGGCDNKYFKVGYDNTFWDDLKGGLRFTSVDIAQGTTVYHADIRIYIAERWGSATIPTKIYGIDEDNTASFGCATNRPKTTAFQSPSIDSGLGFGDTWQTDVTNIVNEIVGRSGWSSGNAMGFIIENNGATGENYIGTDYISDGGLLYCSNSEVRWLLSDNLIDYKYTIFKNKMEI